MRTTILAHSVLLVVSVVAGWSSAAAQCLCEASITQFSNCDSCGVLWTGLSTHDGECIWLPNCTGPVKNCTAKVGVTFTGACANAKSDLKPDAPCRGQSSSSALCPVGTGFASIELVCQNCTGS